FPQVSLLSVVEIGLFPLVCGLWLDVCSLSLFDATLADRETSFRMAPGILQLISGSVLQGVYFSGNPGKVRENGSEFSVDTLVLTSSMLFYDFLISRCTFITI